MRLCLPLLILSCAMALAQQSQSVTLFDFESGVSEWRANPWSGGQGFVEPAPEAKFGKGALRVRYIDVPQACNMISPYLPEDAAWRAGDYDSICLWVKGDGTPSLLGIVLASEAHDLSPTHSAQVPLDSKQWRRFRIKFDTLWNREDQPFVLKDLKRMYLSAGNTHDVLVDHITLQRPLRAVPLPPDDNPGPAAIRPELYANPDNVHLLTFDPGAVLEPTVTAELAVQWPQQGPRTLIRTLPAQAATDEAWIVLPGMPDMDGIAKLTMVLKEPDGDRCYGGRFSFPAVLGAPNYQPEQLSLLPHPKDVRYHPGYWPLPANLRAHIISQPKMAQPAVDYLRQDLRKWFGRELLFDQGKLYKLQPAFLVLADDAQGPPGIPQEVKDKLPELREQGYILHVGEQQIVLAALDEAGMRNAAITLMQALRAASPAGGDLRLPNVTMLDYPSLKVRAVNLGLPTTRWGHPNDAPVPVDFFIDFLQRTVVEQKINVVGLEVLQGMKFDKHPEIAGPAAYSKDEVRQIVGFLKSNGVSVFPLVNSLGHANWLVIPRRELREDDDENTLCTRNPEIRQILTDVYDELIEVFEPEYFHFGLDEVRWKTLTAPAGERCKRCAGMDKRELFVEHVKWLQEYADTRDVKMLMWADMVIREHNGGPPWNLADTVNKLPTGIIMCDWSATLAPLSLWDLSRRGFTVWKCNSRGVNAAQAPFVAGNMWGIWSRVPWLTEAGWNAFSYSYPNQAVAAEYSWNLHPNMMADGVPLDPDFFTKRPYLQPRLSQQPVPNGRGVASLEPGAQTVTVAGLKLEPFAEPLAAEKTLPVSKPVAALYLLVQAELPADNNQRTAFTDLFKQKDNWQGVPIGEAVVAYADGQTVSVPIRYGYHVRATIPQEPFPQAFGALGTVDVGGKLAYLVQWPNPRPEAEVKEIRFVPGQLGAKLSLAGAAVQERRQ